MLTILLKDAYKLRKYILLFNFFFDLEPEKDELELNNLLNLDCDIKVLNYTLVGFGAEVCEGKSVWVQEEDFIGIWMKTSVNEEFINDLDEQFKKEELDNIKFECLEQLNERRNNEKFFIWL